MAEKIKRARVRRFWLTVCAKSGDPGCLGWPDGYHDGPCEYAKAPFHQCTECGRDDIYGELCHDDSCSLAAASITPDAPPAAPSGGL